MNDGADLYDKTMAGFQQQQEVLTEIKAASAGQINATSRNLQEFNFA